MVAAAAAQLAMIDDSGGMEALDHNNLHETWVWYAGVTSCL